MYHVTPDEFLAEAIAGQYTDGAAFDIDETLSETNEHWSMALIEQFGNPEELTSEEIILKYHYFQRYWNSPRAHAFMNAMAESSELTLALRVVDGALEAVHEVHLRVRGSCYITARPHTAAESTLAWLRLHGFPSAPLITRPPEVLLQEGSRWKAKILRGFFPHVRHVFDDSVPLVEHLGAGYQGRVYLLKAHTAQHPTIDVRPCRTWRDALRHFHS